MTGTGVVTADPERRIPWWEWAENGLSIAILALMAVIPVGSVMLRWTTGESVSGANLWVQALNLWITFTGGMIAARANSHLSLSTGTILNIKGPLRDWLAGFTSAVATAITAMLAYASASLVYAETESTLTLSGGIPMWWMQVIMPIGFGVMAVRLAIHGNRTWPGRVAALLTVGLVASLAFVPAGDRTWVVYGGGGVLLVAVALGAPLFTALGGMGMLLFYGAPIPVPLAAVPSETLRIVQDPTLASLPLFTIAGYMLAEGGASKRLVRAFQVWFGWLPGGVAAAAVLVCAFFTTFTGASGVTILALGGLLLPALIGAGYKQKFAVGLLVASGSIGLLFPPSLPVILYGVASQVPISDLFLGGFIPGVILVSLLVGMSVIVAVRQHGLLHFVIAEPGPDGTPPTPLVDRAVARVIDSGKVLWEAKFEVFLPVLVLVGIFGGYVTIFEAAAFTAVYAFLLEVVIHRDLHLVRDVPRVLTECAKLMGGVLIILGVALGFTSYLVDAEVPMMVRDWVQGSITNWLVFMALLNLLLLLVGCLMDIYSAIVVVVPLIVPVAAVFGIHPVHLGILFLANLELGYLTPPVGLNLFLASFRFKIPLAEVYRLALPFLGVMGLGVLLIAYVPILTTWGLGDPVETPDFFEDLDPALEPKGTEPSASPLGLDPDALQRMLEDDGEPSEGDEPAEPPKKLDMDDIQRMLEEE